jgi:energy-coupling factor transporter transmembrane protein EcfT
MPNSEPEWYNWFGMLIMLFATIIQMWRAKDPLIMVSSAMLFLGMVFAIVKFGEVSLYDEEEKEKKNKKRNHSS